MSIPENGSGSANNIHSRSLNPTVLGKGHKYVNRPTPNFKRVMNIYAINGVTKKKYTNL